MNHRTFIYPHSHAPPPTLSRFTKPSPRVPPLVTQNLLSVWVSDGTHPVHSVLFKLHKPQTLVHYGMPLYFEHRSQGFWVNVWCFLLESELLKSWDLCQKWHNWQPWYNIFFCYSYTSDIFVSLCEQKGAPVTSDLPQTKTSCQVSTEMQLLCFLFLTHKTQLKVNPSFLNFTYSISRNIIM